MTIESKGVPFVPCPRSTTTTAPDKVQDLPQTPSLLSKTRIRGKGRRVDLVKCRIKRILHDREDPRDVSCDVGVSRIKMVCDFSLPSGQASKVRIVWNDLTESDGDL